MKLNRAHALFLFFAVAGIVASIISAEHWYSLQLGKGGGPAFCNATEYWNCDRASLSSVGQIASIPLGIFSAIYFSILILLSFTRGISSRLLFMLHLPAWLISAYLVYQLVFVLQTGCILCYIIDLCWLGSGISSWFIKVPGGLKPKLATGIGFIGLLLFSIYPFNHWRELKKLPSSEELNRFRAWYRALPSHDIPLISPMTRENYNSSSKPIIVAEFSDFACPFCEKASRSLVPYLLAQKDLKFVFFPLPLDANCHPDLKRQVHPHSCDWSRVAICAAQQDQFWKIHDELYSINSEGGRAVTDENLKKLGIQPEVIRQCMEAPQTEETLTKLIQVARDLKVNATPTFYLNGKRIQGIIDPRLFSILLEEARKAS